MRLASTAQVARNVAATSARAGRVRLLAEQLRELDATSCAAPIRLLMRSAMLSGDDQTVETGWPEVGDASSTSTLEIDEVLDIVSRVEADMDTEQLGQELGDLLTRATHDEQTLLRSLRIGRAAELDHEPTLTSAIAAATTTQVGAVRRAAATLGSLPDAARLALQGGADALAAVTIEPGRPVLPVIPAPARDIDDILTSGVPAVLEEQLIGDRVQVHRVGDRVSVYDALLDDVSHDFPQVVSLTAGLARGDLVLDGVVIDDPHRPRAARELRFFDVMYDGEPLIDAPLERRREQLNSLVPTMFRAGTTVTADPAVLDEWHRAAAARGQVGLLVKDLSSPYLGGDHSIAWQSLPLTFTVPLVAIAAEWGSGSRSKLLSIVHLGARGAGGEFTSVGRVSRGMSADMLAWLTTRFTALALDDDAEQPSGGLVRLRPELVLDVRCGGFDDPSAVPDELRLRSPRVLRYRSDLSVDDAATVDEIRHLLDDRPVAESLPPSTAPRVSGNPATPTLPPRSADAPTLPGHTSWPDESPPATILPGALPDPYSESIAHATGRPTSEVIAEIEYPPYEEPPLFASVTPGRVALAARILVFLWAAGVGVAALASRSDASPGDGPVSWLALAGLPIALALALTGWWWSDQLTRNLRRLDGRRPGRLRCATAWAAPIVTVTALEFTVARLEPSDTFDVRPMIICGLFAAAMWRPWALVRRIFATLIRLRFDALLATGYLIDLAAFGLIWWRLSVWVNRDGEPSSGEIDTLIGTGASAALALAGGVAVWRSIIRAGDRAQGHRRSSQRTRYEHRMLRLRGVDPTDPDVWWALVQRRADEARAAELTQLIEDGMQPKLPPPHLRMRSVDELIDDVLTSNSVAFRRLDDDRSDELLGTLREQFEAVIGDMTLEAPDGTAVSLRGGETDDDSDEGAAWPPRAPKLLRGEPAPDDESSDVGESAGDGRAPDSDGDGPDEASATPSEIQEVTSSSVDVLPDEGDAVPDDDTEDDDATTADAAAETDVETENTDDDTTDDTTDDDVDEVDEADPADDAAESDEPSDRDAGTESVSTLRRRLGLLQEEVDGLSPLAELLREAKTVQIEAALADQRRQDAEGQPDRRMVPPRLLSFEATRLALVASLGGVTIASAWMVSLVVGASTELNRLTPNTITDLDRARRMFVALLLVALALVPLWAWVASVHAKRADAPSPRRRPRLFLLGLGLGLAGAGSFTNANGSAGLTILLVALATVCAVVAGAYVEPFRYYFGLRSTTLVAWLGMLPVLVIAAGLGGLLLPIEPDASLQVLAFVTVLLALGGALVTVFMALSSIDLEDEIRLTPSLAVPARSFSRRSTRVTSPAAAGEEPEPEVGGEADREPDAEVDPEPDGETEPDQS